MPAPIVSRKLNIRDTLVAVKKFTHLIAASEDKVLAMAVTCGWNGLVSNSEFVVKQFNRKTGKEREETFAKLSEAIDAYNEIG